MENIFSKIALQSGNHEKVQTIMHYVDKENLAKEHKWQKSGNGETLTGKYRIIYRTSNPFMGGK